MGQDRLQGLLACIERFELQIQDYSSTQLKALLHVAIAGGEIPLNQLIERLELSKEQGSMLLAEMADGMFRGEYGHELLKIARLKADQETMVRLATKGMLCVREMRRQLGEEPQ